MPESIMLKNRNETLKEYLEKENEKFLEILNRMKKDGNKNISQIEEILKMNEKGRAYYD